MAKCVYDDDDSDENYRLVPGRQLKIIIKIQIFYVQCLILYNHRLSSSTYYFLHCFLLCSAICFIFCLLFQILFIISFSILTVFLPTLLCIVFCNLFDTLLYYFKSCAFFHPLLILFIFYSTLFCVLKLFFILPIVSNSVHYFIHYLLFPTLL